MTMASNFGRGARAAPAGTAAAPRRARGKGARARADGASRRASRTILPWYLIVVGVAVAASTSAAQKRAVALLTADGSDGTDPLPDAAPDWLKKSGGARSLWTITNRVVTRVADDNLMLIAAGIAFYGMFAVFPALGALVSIYGLFGDTHVVQSQVQQLTVLLPRETAMLLNDSLNALLAKPSHSLNAGLLVSLGIAVWGARAGTSSMMSGLNVAVERPERRNFIKFNLIALGLTFGAILFAIIALTAVAVIPIVIAFLPLDDRMQTLLAYSRWPIFGAFVLLALDIVYRFGPSQSRPRWRLLSVGTIFAVTFWIVASWAFSLYVTRFGSYDTTYGSLGAVIVLLLWFWISALIVLIGATIDAVRADIKTRVKPRVPARLAA